MSSFCFAQTITKVESGTTKSPLNHVFFALPNTVVTAEIEVSGEKQIEPKEEIELEKIFVESFEGKLPNKLTNLTAYSIEKVSGKIKTTVDSENIYKISTNRKFNRKNSIGISVSNSGLITGASVESEDLTVKFITSLFSIATKFVSKMEDKPYDSKIHGPEIFRLANSTSFIKNLTNQTGKNMELIISKKEEIYASRQIYQRDLDKILKGITNRGYFQNSIESTEFRIKLLKEKLKELLVEEKKLKDTFIKELDKIMGTKELVTTYQTVELPWIFPCPEGGFDSVIKQVRNNTETQDLEIVDYASPDNFKKCKSCVKFTLEKEEIAIGDFLAKQTTASTNNGLPFKIPESYKLYIHSNKKKLGELSFKAAGKLGRLNSKINISNVEYYEQLGWIKSFKASNKTIETSDLDSLGSGISSFINKAKGQTELETLTEDTSLLELQLKKIQLQAQLDSISNANN
jgi:hypothetical protein